MASKLTEFDVLLYSKVDSYGSTWLGGYKCEYFSEQPVDTEQVCPVCSGVAREPTQTACGHIFCSLCLEKCVTKSENKKCPIDGEPIDISSSFRDKREEKKILSKQVRCPKGCNWESPLSALETHLAGGCGREEACECGVTLTRVELELHKRTKCPKREIKCEYCGGGFAAEQIVTHLLECDLCPRACSHGCGEKVTRRQDDTHQETCPNKVVPCPFSRIGCEVELMRMSLDQHTESAVKRHLLLACDTITDLRVEISELNSLVSNKPFIWRVSRVEESIRNNLKLTSAPFYREGYKFCARLYMGGVRQGEGTHLSAHLAVMKGSNDSNLEWPIKAGSKFSFTILNQQTDRMHVSMSKTIHPDDFLQPTSAVGKFWGFNKLISHKQLLERTSETDYCARDSVFVSIQLSILSDIPKWLKAW